MGLDVDASDQPAGSDVAMRYMYGVLAIVISLVIVGVAVGQGAVETFAVVQTIGQERPRGIQYDPNFDRFVWVDNADLQLVDAATLEVQHVIAEDGAYNAYRFSHDGRWLALAIDRRIEIWNTQTGHLNLSLEPEGALGIQGPLHFSDDDTILLFDSVVPAPDNLRRSEFDTVILPWLWDLLDARGEARSRLPRFVEAYPVYNMRNGYILGPNNMAIAALPQRLQIVDISDTDLPVIAEIPSNRNERDPLSVWFSLVDDQMYVRPIGSNHLFQVDTAEGVVIDIPVGSQLSYQNIRSFENLALSDQARIIGEPNTLVSNSLLRLLLGDNYQQNWRHHPLTVILIDILQPVTPEARQMGLLLYIFDEQTGQGVIDFLRPVDALQMVLHPDGRHLMVRRFSGNQPIEVYNMDTGALTASYTPALHDPDGTHILAYNSTGDVIISDFQRFDAASGEVIFEELNYHPGFDRYFFTQDGTGLVTLHGSEWWLWDLATRQVIRREYLALRGSLLRTWPDGYRFLTTLETPEGVGVEVVNVGTGERHSMIFEPLVDRSIVDVIPSRDWLHYLVIYGANPYGPYYPGNEIAVYNLFEGKRWFLAGDDLPEPNARQYGWLDDSTIYVASEDLSGVPQPERLYGLAYHASGLPACLVENFPYQWRRWLDFWEQLNAYMRSDTLGRLTMRLCDALPGTTASVDAIFHPTATPTRIPITPTPSLIAGVPVCLTSRFPSQSLEYATVWREIIAGLTEEQVAEMEELLCEGLGEVSVPSSSYDGYVPAPPIEVMTIDVHSGLRASGPFYPPGGGEPPAMQVVLDAFRLAHRFTPDSAILSQDLDLMASRSGPGYVTVYRLPLTYQELAANATATAAPQVEDDPNLISVRPTATEPFDVQGGPRPTLTPTVTPTPPPPPTDRVEQSDYEVVQEYCPPGPLYHVNNPPPDYQPPGRLLVAMPGSRDVWILNPATGELVPDETIPHCGLDLDCRFSFDRQWILVLSDWIYVARPDGSDLQILYEPEEQTAWPEAVYWLDPDTIEIRYQGYMPDRSLYPMTLLQHLDVVSGELTGPFQPYSSVTVNNLSTETVSVQPADGPLVVARTGFNTGRTIGYKYYIVNRDTGAVDYFARMAEYPVGEMTFVWHPLGTALYYHYPFEQQWYIYQPAAGEHRVLGELPDGVWSPDGRYRADWYWISNEARAERESQLQQGAEITTTPAFSLPTPTMMALGMPTVTPAAVIVSEDLPPEPKITVWDSETGLIRRYCLPETARESFSSLLQWSPDNRYLVFRIQLPTDGYFPTVRARTLVLDLATGSTTELSFDVSNIIVWMDEASEGAR